MAKPATYEPVVIDLLRRHPEGMTIRDLHEAVGCSRQQLYKIVAKGKLDPKARQYLPIEVVGKGEYGSDIVAWRGEGVGGGPVVVPIEGTKAGGRFDAVGAGELGQGAMLGKRLRVVAVGLEGDVTVETDEGERLTLHR